MLNKWNEFKMSGGEVTSKMSTLNTFNELGGHELGLCGCSDAENGQNWLISIANSEVCD